MSIKFTLKNTFGAAFSLLALGAVSTVDAQSLEGAGATFPKPIYLKWFATFKTATGTTVNYNGVGSGAGVKALKDKTVDFGASDAPLSAVEEGQMPGGVVHIPTVGGAVVLGYNVVGVPANLKLTGEIISEIYLGKIKTWNDNKIKSANPGVSLPGTGIVPIHRTDGSGTTYIFTHYLKKASSEWASGPGAGKSVNWPIGLGGKGSDGVAAQVKHSDGAIGYFELAFAKSNNLPYAEVKNKAGKYVIATPASTTAAISQYIGQLNKDIKTPTVDAPGADSYPICSLTYILLYKNAKPASIKLWDWAMKSAQQDQAAGLYYAPLSASLVKRNEAVLKSLK